MPEKLPKTLKLDKDELLIQFVSDEIAGEDCASEVLKVAEKEVK